MKKILLTGATDGIGLQTAMKLRSLGHELLIHGRSEEKLRHVVSLLQDIESHAPIQSYQADLSKINDVHALSYKIQQDYDSIDVIINNAGVLKTNTAITADSLDIRFAVNTISPFILSKSLLPVLAKQGRVINVSSAAQAPVDIDLLLGKYHSNNDMQVYAQSKLAITIWSQELAKKALTQQVIVAVNPGSLLASKMVKEGFGITGNSLDIGADVLVKAAISDEFLEASGKYYDNDNRQFTPPHADAQNVDKCKQVMQTLDAIVKRMSTGSNP